MYVQHNYICHYYHYLLLLGIKLEKILYYECQGNGIWSTTRNTQAGTNLGRKKEKAVFIYGSAVCM